MSMMLLICAVMMPPEVLDAGDHLIRMTVEQRARSYRIHIPPQYDATQATPVVVIFHGSSMNGKIMSAFSGLNDKADEAGFIAVYPNGTGKNELFLTFNAGEELDGQADKPDDVKFTAALLDDLATRVHVDPRRIYATGLSSGGMMCYRLAVELPNRFAAIAPVAGTMAVEFTTQPQPISIMHFHGTDDAIVPYGGPDDRTPESVRFRSVDDTLHYWATVCGCSTQPVITDEPNRADDGTTVKRISFEPGPAGHEVIAYQIDGGGHTWPGNDTLFKKALGRSTHDISANDLLWEFFQRHRLP